ncbi:MAG: hypothetical protein ACOC38_12635 [Promethearchaeia archaeon]
MNIINPRFPADPQTVDIILSRILGAALSNAYISHNNKDFLFFGKHRAQAQGFIEHVSALGVVQYSEETRDGRKGFWLHFPGVLGRMLERVGFPVGDFCILNEGLPEVLHKGSKRGKCAYISQLPIERGCLLY